MIENKVKKVHTKQRHVRAYVCIAVCVPYTYDNTYVCM